jgi:hypothetical protein
MTAACLTLLQQSQCPIWPWHQPDEHGLLIEAFPAAQLCHWGMAFQGYNGDKREACNTRAKLVDLVSRKMEIPISSIETMRRSADALDAVLCAFAAIAVSTKHVVLNHLRWHTTTKVGLQFTNKFRLSGGVCSERKQTAKVYRAAGAPQPRLVQISITS